jgi:hypothetical protein
LDCNKMVRDTVPLNKSFDTAETSSMYSADLLSKHIVTLLEDEDDNGSQERQTCNDGSIEVELPRSYDPYAQYFSGKKNTAVFTKKLAAEPSVSAVVANTNRGESHDQEDASVTSLSSLNRGFLGFKKIMRSPWKEDRPFDEDSILESELGEGVEAIYGIGVYTGRKQSRGAESLNDISGDRYMADMQESTAVTCTTRAAKGTSERKRKRKFGFCLLCLLIMVAIIVALVLGLGRDSDESPQGAQVSALGGAGDIIESAVPGISASAGPTTMPSGAVDQGDTDAPSVDSTVEGITTDGPVLDPTTDDPISTQLPTRVPTPAPSPSPTKAPVSRPPTQSPTLASIPVTTPWPTTNPTTRPPIPFPTSSPTGTNPSTAAPTGCQNRISVGQFCHVEGDDVIVVEFVVCNPQEKDWVGVYLEEDAEDPSALGKDYVAWSYTCGPGRCTDPTRENRFGFDTRNIGRSRFRAFLVPGSEEDDPYASMAMSASFLVDRDC